jgi:hypothetical protein
VRALRVTWHARTQRQQPHAHAAVHAAVRCRRACVGARAV